MCWDMFGDGETIGGACDIKLLYLCDEFVGRWTFEACFGCNCCVWEGIVIYDLLLNGLYWCFLVRALYWLFVDSIETLVGMGGVRI